MTTKKDNNEKHLVGSNPGGLFDSKGNLIEGNNPKKTTEGEKEKQPVPEEETKQPDKKNINKTPDKKNNPAQQTPSNKKNIPARKLTRAETEEKRIDQINRMTVMELVQEAPKKRFIASMVGTNPSASEYSRAEQIFMQEATFAMQAFRDNDYLKVVAQSDKEAVIDAIVNVAQTNLTLNPVLKLGYLVPMDKKVRFWASYMGKREIVMRTGIVKDCFARLVYESDNFEIKFGSGGYLKHDPDPWGEKEMSKLKGGYWYLLMKDGTEKFDTMKKEEIEAIAKRSPSANAAHSPWKSDWEQMALKTIFNRGFKEMPKSGITAEQLKALEVSDRIEEDTLKSWIKQNKNKEDSFDNDFSERIQDVDPI